MFSIRRRLLALSLSIAVCQVALGQSNTPILPTAPPPPLLGAFPSPPVVVVPLDDFAKNAEEHVQRLTAMSDEEAKAYLRAVGHFEHATPFDARRALQGFIKQYPKSRKCADILYRLAVLHLDDGNEAFATQQLEQLVLDHYQTTWARLALKHHFREETFFKLATRIRDKALETKSREHDLAATDLFGVGLERYGNSNPDRHKEAVYKLNDYLLRAHGDFPGARESLAKLAAAKETDNRWVKLAQVRIADAKTFMMQLETLTQLSGTDGEVSRLKLELTTQHLPKLTGDDALRVRFLRGEALIELDRTSEGLAEWRALAKEHPQSHWAAEAIFWLAEHAYSSAFAPPSPAILPVQFLGARPDEPANAPQIKEAQALYRRLAMEHPMHPRAKKAAQWADQMDRQQQVMRDLESSLLKTYAALQKKFSLSIRLSSRLDGVENWSSTVAWRDPQHYRMDMVYEKAGMSLVTNPQGTWYWDRTGPIRHSKQPLDLPMPVLQLSVDNNKCFIGLGVQTELKEPTLRVSGPPAVARHLVEKLAETCHLSSEMIVQKDTKRRRFRLESIMPHASAMTTVEIMVNADGVLESIHLHYPDAKGKSFTLTAEQLVFGGDVPVERFQPIANEGTAVVPVDGLNPYILVGQVVQIYQEMLQAMGAFQR